jgi:hypothetical protein
MPECRELSLEEMLIDPIVRAVMAADRVDPDEVRALARVVAERRQTAAPAPAPGGEIRPQRGLKMTRSMVM